MKNFDLTLHRIKNRCTSLIYKALFVTSVVAVPSHHVGASLLIDFADGQPPSSLVQITELTPSTNLGFSGGKMNVGMNASGDGVDVLVDDFDAVWIGLMGLDLQGFTTGTGFAFEMLFGNDDSITAEVFQTNSTKVKVKQKQGGVEKLLKEVEFRDDFDIRDITTFKVDWAPPPPEFPENKDRFILILRVTGIGQVAVGAESEIRHEGATGTHFQLKGISLSQDPTFSVGSIVLDEVHDVPEPSPLVMVILGLISLPLFSGLRHKQQRKRGIV